jgi:hypothetical protein
VGIAIIGAAKATIRIAKNVAARKFLFVFKVFHQKILRKRLF